jgi:hypothetical protein
MPEFSASPHVPEPKRPKNEAALGREIVPPARAADAAQVEPEATT